MKVKRLAQLAMMTALTVALSMMVIIPIPATKGIVTLCEVGIYLSACLFGGTGGLIVGSLSGGLIDLLSGYPQWMIFSFVIHGLQGYIAGQLFHSGLPFAKVWSLLLASVWMIVGYFFATSLLYTWPAGIASIPGNIVQTAFGMGVTYLSYGAILRSKKMLHLGVK